MISLLIMEQLKTWVITLGFGAVAAGALLSRDACIGSKRPPPEPAPMQTASPPPEPAATPEPAPTQTYATPP